MSNSSYIPVFAHRGASAYALENTFKAFEKALELGADGIELDIQFSKEGYPIVYHDPQLSRLVGINKLVSDCTMEELLSFKLGKPWRRFFSSFKMPAFDAVLAWAKTHKLPLNIELKSTILDNQIGLGEFLQGLTLPVGSHFSSFHYELLEIVKKHRPEYETALIATKKVKWDLLADYKAADTVHMHKRYYKPRYLEACVVSGKACRFYAIDGTEPFLTNPHHAVIGWITDYPDKVKTTQQRV
ncbi:glycerophosphodiester phosphodiesterase [Lysinibacillus sp. ZYM-1]|uniref:glycerophosphodiester phosphodiesterase n=1 Tax=Lysinibacillus sp. ZYM-1 TaxID=1681184 RepID=UPI0006CE65C0|nr:glycerophosphodiester phosphodiesterase [Lysinibacillus sp. ZYM-1]KPN89569.1 glycerophosphodiester phosphodiesterase [Lysinibacillus sp. ZYM-1]